jgi:predicted double-glycine peptidase
MISSYPIYKQSPDHCGAANLRGIFHYWTGKDYGEKTFSELTKTKESEGCGLEEMVNASEQMGFLTKKIEKNGTIDMLRYFFNMNIPPIICYTDPIYEEDHWATVLGINHSITLADTNLPGTRKFRIDDFYNLWSLSKEKYCLNNTLIIIPKQ